MPKVIQSLAVVQVVHRTLPPHDLAKLQLYMFKRDHSLSRDAWTDLLTLLRTYTFHDADLSDMSEYKMVRAIRHLTGFRTVEVGKCPKGHVSYGAKRLQDLEECPTPGCREKRFTLGKNGEKIERSTQRFYDPAPFVNALRAHPVIGPTLANAKPSDEVVDLHKASGGSGSYPVVRRWVDGLYARTLYANGDLKPDDIPLAIFSDGTEVLAHSNANRKLHIFEGERTSFSAAQDRHRVLCRDRIVACIADTLEQAALGNLVGARGLASLSAVLCSSCEKAFENDEGVIVLVLDHPEWAGLVDTATTFQIPGGQDVRLDNERNYKRYRRVVEAMKRHPTKLESLRRRTGISGEAPIEALDLFKDAYSTFLPLDYMHLIGINSGSTFINILVRDLDSKARRHAMTLTSDAIARMTPIERELFILRDLGPLSCQQFNEPEFERLTALTIRMFAAMKTDVFIDDSVDFFDRLPDVDRLEQRRLYELDEKGEVPITSRVSSFPATNHRLMHGPDFMKRMGPLREYSACGTETMMGYIKGGMRSKSKPVESGMNLAEMRNMMMILRLKYDIPTMDDLRDTSPRDHASHAQLPGYKLHTLKKTARRPSQKFVDLTEEVAVFYGGSVTSLDEGWRRLEGAGASAVTLLGSGNEMRNTQGTVNCKTARFMSMEADNSQRAGEVVYFVELGVTTLKEKQLLSLVDVFPVAMDIRGLYESFDVDGPRNLSLIGVERLRQLVSIIPNTMRPPPTAAELAQGAGPAVTAPDTYAISVFPHSTATPLRRVDAWH
ncbi:BZ3500_MvSof-1268-A1-R1_Chr3-1g05932 [Microbotryum saponariae]|uniref:BZ3500_MvSof-1268-A1-R1_Chr3-1g05932 protein n=1 Tax=Microbotryum saponariae TaxID=289078 RepID=A0A2X0NC27_9BASI|nr:BZ3500_MvSof-1268-A1-R1_Chr3-1g05932 [Microbotryum saponariae]SDA05122.1 BZ3501_MvSof-1269-A2-R1_Chr3-1g05602 [Microbotryum saponariae]